MRAKIVIPKYVKPEILSEEKAEISAMYKKYIAGILNEDTEIAFEFLEKGPSSVECFYDIAEASPYIMRRIEKAEKEGFDAVIVGSFTDAGVVPGKELVHIPVIGPAETSMIFSCALGCRFSILSLSDRMPAIIRRIARRIGVDRWLLSIENIKEQNEKQIKRIATEKSEKAIEKGAETIILASMFRSRLVEEIRKELEAPVLDPAATSLKMAEILYTLKLSHSKLAYPKSIDKKFEFSQINRFSIRR